ncbi:unnamed protein product [Chilo suppressalis]|uniref:Ig-like domain-containing protein n=1 Tax=Chilo suppressalis TaxID=168631 RepID=A0ABN8B3B6_CHISP|nr:unnamed protein product [Chilo suppressalis]
MNSGLKLINKKYIKETLSSTLATKSKVSCETRVDFRNGPPVHWAVAGEFGARTHFVLNESDPSSAHLAVEKVAHQDEGVYRCRIDYVDSPTRNYKSPRIYDFEGREILGNIAGPFREGQDLLLSCQAAGGKPSPDVSWWRGEERLSITRDGSVCQLLLQSLSREMAVKPQFVRVSGKGAARAGQDRSFVCTTRGSKPAPNIDWFINSQLVDSTLTQVDVDGEVTKSVLSWHIRREDSGRQLVCRVSNPWFPAYTLEDSLMFDVMSRPECAAGSVVQQLAGTPGGEVRARCSVTAPSTRDAGPLRFYWTYNGTKDVLPIPASNVTVMGSSSTVIHGLPSDNIDEDLGWLACWASNDIGNQREPCLFRIMPAALPEPPSNCEIENEVLHCEPGHDGGLTQRFLLEALEVRPRTDPVPEENDISTLNDQGISSRGLTEAVYRARNDRPQFSLDALSPGKYTLLVYSETPRGRSPRPAALHSVAIRTADDLDVPGSLQTMTPSPPSPPSVGDNSVALLTGAALSLVLLTILTTLCVTLVVMCKKKRPRRDPEQNTILRRNVGVSMYGGSSMSQNVVPTVVVRGHRGSRVLAARWSGVLDEAPLAVLALDTRPHETDSNHSDAEQETALNRHISNMETQTDTN